MAETKNTSALIMIGAPLTVATVFFLLVIPVTGSSSTSAACAGPGGRAQPDAVPGGSVAGYSGEQLVNAAHIINAAAALGLGRYAQVLGVMTAMGESSLQVLDRGDAVGPDSRGLFQQRDNGAWGTYADRMNPTTSATNFFTALTRVPDWQTLEPTIAAHKVQGNADPFHYETYYPAATTIVTTLTTPGTDTPAAEAGCGSGVVVLPLSAGFNMTGDYGPRLAPVAGASSWHPAVDLQHSPNPCGDQIYSISAGTVVYVGGYQVTIKTPDGHSISYLHMRLADVSVTVGNPVTPGTPIALVGNEGPSTGCHLDIRINKHGTTNPAVAALPAAETQGGPPATAGYVNPEQFFALHGIELCPPASCARQYR